jgi:hypothetical protein
MRSEGWSLSKGKTHYYKNGISLCGYRKLNVSNRVFDSERLGNIYFKDCAICCKKQKELLLTDNLPCRS